MKKRIGDFFLEKGLIDQSQLEEIIQYSQRSGLRFGEAGMEMGLFTRDDLISIFGPAFQVDFFYLDPKFFPKTTQNLISAETIIQYGVLPLGIKTEYRFFRAQKRLNLGFLNPGQSGAIQAVENAAQEAFQKNNIKNLKIYLILADQFLDVLHDVYGLPEDEIAKRDSSRIDETLQMFLGGNT